MFQWMKNKFKPIADKKDQSQKEVESMSKHFEHYRREMDLTPEEIDVDKISEKLVLRKAIKDLAPGQESKYQALKQTNDSLNFNQYTNQGYSVSPTLLNWYGSQGFIGYQMCGILSQHWLIRKACAMPAEDAIRKGYTITSNDGQEISPEILQAFDDAAIKYKVNDRMREFITFGRVFGVRVAVFQVESKDPDYYRKPFNIDGVTPGSYRGIAMVDPYWVAPLLDADAVGNPASQYFYEPTWWSIQGKLYHRTHCVIFRTEQPPDILKPTYFYGGIPLTQQIMERVYCAERMANEIPLLTMTKRLNIMKVDLAAALSNPQDVAKRVTQASQYRDNYGYYLIDNNEELSQLDTSLTSIDDATMTEYQLVAAGSCVPATKLLGTTPKGFNSTGEYEEASYHERLESMQTHDLCPFLEKHLQMVIKSDIGPEFGKEDLKVSISWHSLDAITAKERAEINAINARTAVYLADVGAVDGQDVRNRIIADNDSGYNGLDEEAPPIPELAEGEKHIGTSQFSEKTKYT
jgi:hypothetical protein